AFINVIGLVLQLLEPDRIIIFDLAVLVAGCAGHSFGGVCLIFGSIRASLGSFGIGLSCIGVSLGSFGPEFGLAFLGEGGRFFIAGDLLDLGESFSRPVFSAVSTGFGFIRSQLKLFL